MKNTYSYDIIYVDYATIGEPAIIRVANYADGSIEKPIMTPSPVVNMTIDTPNHTYIETEMCIIKTSGF